MISSKENIKLTELCNEPPGYIDDIDLNLTRQLEIEAGWKCKWFDCKGLTKAILTFNY